MRAELRSHPVDEQIMVMPAARPHRWTREDVALLVDQRDGYSPRYELVDGELLVTPGPGGRHQRITFRLADDPVTHPILICEVLSRGSARHDRITKRRAFQRRDVPEYWVVDGSAEAIEVWHPGDERALLVDDLLSLWPAGCAESFGLDVKRFFADAADNPPIA